MILYKRLTASKLILKILAFLHNRFCDYALLFLLISVHYYYAKNSMDAVAFHTTIYTSLMHLSYKKHYTYQCTELTLWNQCCLSSHCGVCVWGGGEERRGFPRLPLKRVLTFLLFGAKKLNFS